MAKKTPGHVAIPAMWSNKIWSKNIGKLSILGPKSPLMILLSDSAVQALTHLYEHGNTGRCKELYDLVGGSAGAIRGESLKEWFRIMSGNQLTARLNEKKERVWAMTKGWSKDKFKMEDALSKPFWEFMGKEAKPNYFSIADNLLEYLKGLPKRIDSKNDKGEVRGDAVAAKELVAKVFSFADAEARKLTREQRGEEQSSNDAIIAKGTGTSGPVAPSPSLN